jgi:multidrug efflux pump subunit AcrB
MSEYTEPPLDRQHGILAYFATNSVAANLTMALMIIGGVVAGFGLTAQVFPTVDPGQISIGVPYPGATPTEVEEGITRRVEEAVMGIEGVEKVSSTASENNGSIAVELKDFVDPLKVRDDVEAAVDRLVNFPPEEAEKPDIVVAQTISDVITIVVASELPEMELRHSAERLEESLLALPAVSLVSLFGARDYEIAIEVKKETLRSHDLTIQDIANAIRLSSLNLSSGELRGEGGDLLIRTNTKRYTGREFENVVVRALPDGTFLRLIDVATIQDAFTESDLVHQFNGRRSVFVKVQKSDAEDALDIAADVRDLLANYQPRPGVDIAVWDDQTEILEDRLGLLLRNGILGFALVFLFLVIMLDLRLAIWVAMGVPISFLGAFLFFDFFGVNLNMISLFALIIVLGIVVDDAVIVGENIISEQESGLRGVHAALAGITGVIGPVTVGVLTTMAAFAPLLFVTGTFGQILGPVPVVVILVLAMSLIEAFFILPAHLTHGRPWSRWPLDAIQARVAQAVQHFRDQMLVPLIARAVRFRYITIAIGVLMLALAGSLVATGAVRFIFFPSLDSTSLTATIAFPIGTPFKVTEVAAQRIVDAAAIVNEKTGGRSMRATSVTIGGQMSDGQGPGGGGSMSVANPRASVQIQLESEPLRAQSAAALERMWRLETGDIAGAERLSFSSSFFGGATDVNYELAHQDDQVLEQAVEELKSAYRQIPAMFEIQDSNNLGKRQFDIELTPTGEAAGLTPSDIARQLRRNFFGEEVQRIQRGRQELKVMVRYPREQRRSARDFFNVRVRLADGTEAPLSAVAQVKESRASATIERVNGLRIVSVSGRVDTDIATPTEVDTLVAEQILPDLQQRFVGLQVSQSGFGVEQSRDIASLSSMASIALLIIFGLIATQLKSYALPLIVLAGIPFGAAGALMGHYLLGYDLSFISIFGMVALSGVVVNDSLVLIDRYNKIRLEDPGLPAAEAIVKAAQRRFRAILLTTATTALGLTPMLFETSTQAQFMIPMAVSLATGIVFASVIILFLIPALVIILEDLKRDEPVAELGSA